MGLFQGKQKPDDKPIDETSDGVQRFFDDYFTELRERGQTIFDAAVEEHATKFRRDLDATISDANADLKKRISERLDEQFAENNEVIRGAQTAALKSLTDSATALKDQQEQLGARMQKSIVAQEAMLVGLFEDSKHQITSIQAAQAKALQSLEASVEALEDQHRELAQAMQKSIAEQEATLVHAFEDNMAQIIEYYLLGALGDQYDLKAQLPAIIQQMEQNKQAIVDDMQL